MEESQSVQQVLSECGKMLWDTDQPKNVKERSLRRASFLTIQNYQVLGQIYKSYTFYFRSNSGYSVRKLDKSPTNFAQNASYSDLVYTNKNSIYLNTAIFFQLKFTYPSSHITTSLQIRLYSKPNLPYPYRLQIHLRLV